MQIGRSCASSFPRLSGSIAGIHRSWRWQMSPVMSRNSHSPFLLPGGRRWQSTTSASVAVENTGGTRSINTTERVGKQFSASAAAAANSGLSRSDAATDGKKDGASTNASDSSRGVKSGSTVGSTGGNSTAASTDQPVWELYFGQKWQHLPLIRHIRLVDVIAASPEKVVSVCNTLKHPETGVTITLIPIVHVAHPTFWYEVDKLCGLHHSVLMEGRYSPLDSIASVPPREAVDPWPAAERDSEGWEPPHEEGFWQPFSWGVAGSEQNTVVHAADAYDYENLPRWATLRFNIPVIGSFARDKHCLLAATKLYKAGYRSFAIPWGVAHIPIMTNILLNNGFVMMGQTQLTVFDARNGPISEDYCYRIRRSKGGLWRFLGDYSEYIYTVLGILVLFFWTSCEFN